MIDDFNREVLWIEVDTSIPAQWLIRVLNTLADWRDFPNHIRMVNGPELTSIALKEWAARYGV